MKTHLLSLLAGMALLTSVGVAGAAEPIALSEGQMDNITAGTSARITGFTDAVWTFSGGTTLKVPSGTIELFEL